MPVVTGVFGRPVTAAEVEQLRPGDGPTEFVRLCGALIGRALAERVGSFTLPSITERVDVPDGGVDAEFTESRSHDLPETWGLVGPGRTVYQFKYRDARAADRRRVVAGLTRALRRDGPGTLPQCDRYVFMTNVQFTPVEARRLRDAIVERSPQLTGKPVVVWGAAEIALALNSTPYLRHLFFAGRGLCTLDYAEAELKQEYRALGWPDFVGREGERQAIETFVASDDHPALLVTGAPYVGKTRLVLEALRPHGASVLWVSDPRQIVILDVVRDLDVADAGGILVVDRCDRGLAASVLAAARARTRVKTIAILRGAVGTIPPGGDVVHVEALPEQDALQIVRLAFPDTAFQERAWIVDRAGGNPGLILHLAPVLAEARASASLGDRALVSTLGRLLEGLLVEPLPEEERRALRVASLLPALGVEGTVGREADALAAAMSVSPDWLRERLNDLERTGLVVRSGRFIQVVPPLLADRLAGSAFGRLGIKLADLRRSLPREAIPRLLERLRDLSTPDARSMIEHLLLAPDGWFPDLEDVIAGARAIEILAPAAPRAAVERLGQALESLSPDDLRTRLSPTARRAIVGALDILTLRSETFERAARLLLQLAEVETESYANNATGVFGSVFHWQHPEVPVPLSVRLKVLDDSHHAQNGAARRRVVAKACGMAFGHAVVSSHHPEGPVPPARRAAVTGRELFAYGEGVLALIGRLIDDPHAEVREEAVDALRRSFPVLLGMGIQKDGLDPIGRKAIGALTEAGKRTGSAEQRERIVSRLELSRRDLLERDTDSNQAIRDAVRRIDDALHALTSSDFRARLWRWVGPPSFELEESSTKEGEDQSAQELDALADALAGGREPLAPHLDWLTGTEASARSSLFVRLGRRDRGGSLFLALLQRASGPFWPEAFAAYVHGWADVERAAAEAKLDELVTIRPDLSAGLAAASQDHPTRRTVDRLLRLLTVAGPRAPEVARQIADAVRWDAITDEDGERLMAALSGLGVAGQAYLLFPLTLRIWRGPGLSDALRELAWRVLDATALRSGGVGGWTKWDRLAGELGKQEPARLLALVAQTLRKLGDEDDLGDPQHSLHRTLRTLEQHDRHALIRMLLEVTEERGWRGPTWTILTGLLDATRDREPILAFAEAKGATAARRVVELLDADDKGFWAVARDLLVRSGGNPDIRDALAGALYSGSWSGSREPSVHGRLAAARALARDPEPAARDWAVEAESRLERLLEEVTGEEQEKWIWSYGVSRNRLRDLLEKEDSAERWWAIRQLLDEAPFDRVRELLSIEEIHEALQKLPGLKPERRRIWESYVRVGGSAH